MAARCSKMSAVARVSALVASWGRRPMSYQVSAVCNKVEPAVNEVSKQVGNHSMPFFALFLPLFYFVIILLYL